MSWVMSVVARPWVARHLVATRRTTWSDLALSLPFVAGLLLGCAVSLGAQASSQSASEHNAVSGSVSSDNASAIMTPHRTVADTERMTWGHLNYTTYGSADQCDRAMMDVAAEVWRTNITDTLAYDVRTDTLPTAALAVAHACGDRFVTASAISSMDPRDLWSALRLSLALGKPDLAAAAVTRRLSLAKTPSEQAYVLESAIENYLGAHTPQLAAAQALLPRLDALGDVAKKERFEAHSVMLHYWHLVYNPDSLHVEADRAVALLKRMTADERDEVEVLPPHLELIGLARDAQDFTTEKTLLDRAFADVGSWHDGQATDYLHRVNKLFDLQKALYGKTTKALNGKYWYNTGGTQHPLAGKISLIVHVDHRCGTRCAPLYAVLRQLKAQYGDEVDLALITDTRGFAPGTGPLPADSEAVAVSHYYLDFLRMPGALLVDESPKSKGPDGHVHFKPSPIGSMFAEWDLLNTILVDRTGKVQWLGQIESMEDKRMLQAAIERVKKAPAATPSAAPKPSSAPPATPATPPASGGKS